MANGGIASQPEEYIQNALKNVEDLAARAKLKVKEAQEFIMKKLQECSRVQTPSFAKLKASLPKKLSGLAQAEPKLTKAKADVQKAYDDIALQKAMSELKAKFSGVETGAAEVPSLAKAVVESLKAEEVDTDKVFAATHEVYTKKDDFMKKVSELKTEITAAVRQTMGQKSDNAGGLKKGAHELLIGIAQLETKVNTELTPILTEVETQKTELGVKAMQKKVEEAKAGVATHLGDEDTDAKADDLDVESAKMRILKCETAQTVINEAKTFHQMLLPPGGKGIPKAQFAIRMTKLAPQTQAIQQLESKVYKTRSIANLVIQRVEAAEMLEEVKKEVDPAEELAKKVSDTAAPILSSKPGEPVSMSLEEATKLHDEVAKLGEEAKTALAAVKQTVVTK